jgi:hypothetical protein
MPFGGNQYVPGEDIRPIDEPEVRRAKRAKRQREYYRRVIKNKTGDDLKTHKNLTKKHHTSWKKKNKERYKVWQRNWHIKKKYGITREQFDDMLRRQGFACAICGSGHTGSKNDWHIDHCHATGKIRGLLCNGCNTGLGGFRDNAKIMKSAIKYLKGGGFAI